jgi:hypothetical protein
MPLRIDRVEMEMDVQPSPGSPASPDSAGLQAALPAQDQALSERLRPIVLSILNDELRRLRRQQG